MQKNLLSFLLLYVFVPVCAQRSVLDMGTRWEASAYGKGIIKITCTPAGYTRNENITGAVMGSPMSQEPSLKLLGNPDGGVVLQVSDSKIQIRHLTEKKGYRVFLFNLAPGEKIFGGGSRALPLDRRGYSFPLYNNAWYAYEEEADNLNFSVPFFTSSKGYALFFDNASKGYVDIGKSKADQFEIGFMSGELNVYVIFGSDYRQLLQQFTQLTGKQPLPPRWVLGNFMSRFGYTGEAQINGILEKTAQQAIGTDAVIFDLFWFGDSIKGSLGNLDWVNRKQWPDPPGMLRSLNRRQIHPVLIAEPFLLEGTLQYPASKKYLATDSSGQPFLLTDFYFGRGGLLDIFRKEAGDWIWDVHYKRQLGNGVNAWWTDLAEPERHPAPMLHDLSSMGFSRKFGADEVHNAYGHHWSRMLYQQYAKHLPNARLFHLTRSGFAGSQRYSIFPWSGDVSRGWKGFRAQLRIMQGMSMSGIPFMHADAGGFAGGTGDQELYVRWLQFAAFSPILRPHGTALGEIDPNAFNFPSEPALMDSPYNRIAKQAIDFRYRLLPYNYTLCYRQAMNGEPLVAPLYFHFPADSLSYRHTDQYCWGNDLLVAPVLEKGALSRTVYLPGGNWYRLNYLMNKTGKAPERGMVECAVALDEIPVFARAGSFIPTWKHRSGQNASQYRTDTLVVHYFYDSRPSESVMYDDDGESRDALEKGKHQLLTFRARPNKRGGVSLQVSGRGGSYSGKPGKRIIHFVVHKTRKTLNREESNAYDGTLEFDGKAAGVLINR